MTDDNQPSDFDVYARKIMGLSVALIVTGALLFYIFSYSHDPSLFAGFCLGAIFSMLRWRLIIWELKKFGIKRSGVGSWLRGYFFRYGLTGAVIAISLASGSFAAVTAIPGVFLVNAVIICEQVAIIFIGRYKRQESWE